MRKEIRHQMEQKLSKELRFCQYPHLSALFFNFTDSVIQDKIVASYLRVSESPQSRSK